MFTFERSPKPTLTVDGEAFHGINILEKLEELKKGSKEANQLFQLIASNHQRQMVPRLGFRLTDSSAVMPSKRIVDVGYDLTIVDVFKKATELTTLYETHVALVIPIGFYAEVVPRSSISKTGYMLANNIGIIDPGYTGSIKIPLIKVDPSAPDLELPARVAQLIIKSYVVSESYDATADNLIQTERGAGGFGSTG